MGTVSFRSAPILYFYLQARDGRTPYKPFAPFFYALSRAYFTKGIFSTIRKIFSSHLLSSTNKSDYNASTVRRVLQYFAGSTGVLSSSDCSTFRTVLELEPELFNIQNGTATIRYKLWRIEALERRWPGGVFACPGNISRVLDHKRALR